MGHLEGGTYIGGNIAVASVQGVLSIEETDGRYVFDSPDGEYFVRTNHFCNLELEEGTLEYLSENGGAAPICRHRGKAPGITVSSVIYDLQRRELHYACGNPCKNPYIIYKPAGQ